jgi:hypothetical protein
LKRYGHNHHVKRPETKHIQEARNKAYSRGQTQSVFKRPDTKRIQEARNKAYSRGQKQSVFKRLDSGDT